MRVIDGDGFRIARGVAPSPRVLEAAAKVRRAGERFGVGTVAALCVAALYHRGVAGLLAAVEGLGEARHHAGVRAFARYVRFLAAALAAPAVLAPTRAARRCPRAARSRARREAIELSQVDLGTGG